MKWEDVLIREAKIAYDRGEQITFTVNKRVNQRNWRIYRKRLVTSGEEYYEEED